MNKLGFGGGCHWCTEAVFQSLNGVVEVQQGWIASTPPNQEFSEAVIVHFDDTISLEALVEIHLLTHSSTNNHTMRKKYRSAVYYFSETDHDIIKNKIERLSLAHDVFYITESLPFKDFKMNSDTLLNYYLKNKTAPFCENYINPKLELIRKKFIIKDQ
jgi:peptide-methionine (S)-S-oxide reductase